MTDQESNLPGFDVASDDDDGLNWEETQAILTEGSWRGFNPPAEVRQLASHGNAYRKEHADDRIRRLGLEATRGRRSSFEAIRHMRDQTRDLLRRIRKGGHEPQGWFVERAELIESTWRSVPLRLRRGPKRRSLASDEELLVAVKILNGRHWTLPECSACKAPLSAGDGRGRPTRFSTVETIEGRRACGGHSVEECFYILEAIAKRRRGRRGESARTLRDRYFAIPARRLEELESIDAERYVRLLPGFILHELALPESERPKQQTAED